MRLVIDTNVIASAIFFGGKSHKFLKLMIEGCYDAYMNKAIVEEYENTIKKLRRNYPDKTERFALPDIISEMHQIDTVTEVHICRDPDDDKFIGCAIDSKSKYIVSGDKDLLSIDNYEDVEIVTVTEFLRDNFPYE